MEPTRAVVRIRARLSLKLPISILCRESTEYKWTEKTRLTDVNQFGAGFTLTRPVEVGRIIQLTAPLPHQLRCFDQHEPLYSVWSLVRHCAVVRHHPVGFRIGVAFVGRNPPASYQEDPATFYEPLPIKLGQSVMWNIARRPPAKQRRETRLAIPLEVLVETLDENGNSSVQEYTVTEAISSLGACIPSSLDVEPGRVIRITSVTDRVSIFGAVRSRTILPDGIARLGVEFIADRWPLQRDPSFLYQRPTFNVSPPQTT